jgi:hypothetical protein
MEAAAGAVGMSVSEFYKARSVADTYTEAQIDMLSKQPGLTYSHIAEAVRIPWEDRRLEALAGLEHKPPAQQTVRAFEAEVASIAQSPEAQRANNERAKASAEANGTTVGGRGVCRPGTGHGSGPTPIGSTKQAGSLAAKLKDRMTDVVVVLKDCDLTESQEKNLSDAINSSLGVVVEVLRSSSEFVKSCEEFLSVRGLYNDEQGIRRDAIAAAASALKVLSVKLKNLDELTLDERQAELEKVEDTPKVKKASEVEAKEAPTANPMAASTAASEKMASIRARLTANLKRVPTDASSSGS